MHVLRKVDGELFPNDVLVGRDELAQRFGRNLGVGLHSGAVAQGKELVLEVLAIDLEHDVAVHLNEAAIRIECETLVA